MNHNDIIIKPVITEKTTALMELNKYVFQVAMTANKIQVRQAFNEMFGIKPEKVNVSVVRGKEKRLRYKAGKRSAWKKAIVTVKPGEKIEIFDLK